MTGTVSYELLFESLDKQWNKNISSYELKAGVLIVKIKCCCDFSVFLLSQPGYKGTTCTCKPIVRVTLTGWQVGNPTLLCSWVLFTSRWDNLIWILWVMRVDGLYGIWSQDILGILSALLTVPSSITQTLIMAIWTKVGNYTNTIWVCYVYDIEQFHQ